MSIGSRGANPIWLLDDLTGNLFDDTFYMYVLQNVLPYVPATVYHDPDLLIPWTSPIQFLANGTLPTNIFFESEIVYRLEFRQNTGSLPPSQNDALIYEVSDYTAGSGGTTPGDNVSFSTGNQVTNPQFSLINFTSPLAISATNPAPTDIAPGWSFVAAGTGTAAITLVPLDSANTNPSNAPYALRLTLSGWTAGSVFLKQRFQQNGMLWAGEYVSNTVTARLDGSPQSISASLIDSNNAVLGVVLPSTVINESWNEFTGHALLPATTNPDVPPAAYIEYSLALPSNIDIYLTSFQLVAQDLPLEPKFEQESIDRQIDHTFHYYRDPLIFKPIPSLLTGWDFALNPAQARGDSMTITTGGAYLWDQLIGTASADCALARSTLSGGLAITMTSANSAVQLTQYLSGSQAKKIAASSWSVNVNAWKGTVGTTANVKVYLFRAPAATVIPTVPTVLGNVSATGVFTLSAAGWTEITRENGLASANLKTVAVSSDINAGVDYAFAGWQLTDNAQISDTDKFAIVVTLATVTAATVIDVASISLVPGDIATRPAPQTKDEVLRECQYYYEKSYDGSTVPGTVTDVGRRYALNELGTRITGSVTTNVVYLQSLSLIYDQVKRIIPTATFYSPASASVGNIQGRVLRNAADVVPAGAGALGSSPADYVITKWTETGQSTKGLVLICNSTSTKVYDSGSTTPPSDGDESMMLYHYVADARLGVI